MISANDDSYNIFGKTFLMLLILTGMTALSVAQFAGGEGTEEDPYQISNLNQLQNINNELDAYYELVDDIDGSDSHDWTETEFQQEKGSWAGSSAGSQFELIHTPIDTVEAEDTDDGSSISVTVIDAEEGIVEIDEESEAEVLFDYTTSEPVKVGFKPIGYGSDTDDFTGTLDGQGHTISNLYVGHITDEFGGTALIGRSQDAIIQNIHIEDIEVDGVGWSGGLVGRFEYTFDDYAEISGVSVQGEINSVDYDAYDNEAVGLLVGATSGNLNDGEALINEVSVEGKVEADEEVGLLIGHLRRYITVENTYAQGEIVGEDSVGGLVGRVSDDRSEVRDSYSASEVQGIGSDVGALIGANEGTANNLYWDSDITAQGDGIGDDSGTSQNILGLSTSDMTGNDAKSNMGELDFEFIWTVQEGEYPQLQTLLPPVPVADFDFPTDLAVVIVGEEISFTDQSDPVSDEIVSWSWDFGDETTSTVENPTHTYSESGDYQVELTVENDEGETDTIIQTVSVNSIPNAGFSFESDTMEPGDQINFTDNSIDEYSSVDTWSWNFDDGTTSTEQNPSHVFEDEGEYNVSLTVEDEHGVEASAFKTIDIESPTTWTSGGSGPGRVIEIEEESDRDEDETLPEETLGILQRTFDRISFPEIGVLSILGVDQDIDEEQIMEERERDVPGSGVVDSVRDAFSGLPFMGGDNTTAAVGVEEEEVGEDRGIGDRVSESARGIVDSIQNAIPV